jgi:hypothetical protein
MVDISKRLVEVDAILNYLSKENYQKIPKEIIQAIKENKDKNYTWEYDEFKEFDEQNINRDTLILLSYINMEYLLNGKQKEYMEKMYNENEIKLEEEKRKKYSTDDIFRKKLSKNEMIENIKEKQEDSLVMYKEKFITKIFRKIINFFKING